MLTLRYLADACAFSTLLSSFVCISYKDIERYSTFSMLPRDISQLIFNDAVKSQCLTSVILEAFRDCALQVMLDKKMKLILHLLSVVLVIVLL